jgi:hypothetical protein
LEFAPHVGGIAEPPFVLPPDPYDLAREIDNQVLQMGTIDDWVYRLVSLREVSRSAVQVFMPGIPHRRLDRLFVAELQPRLANDRQRTIVVPRRITQQLKEPPLVRKGRVFGDLLELVRKAAVLTVT